MVENSDRRLLAAIRFVDASTGAGVISELGVDAGAFQVHKNWSGLYLILNGPSYAQLSATFDLTGVTIPPSQVISVTVTDAGGQYLPRRVSITVPRNQTAPISDPASILQPQLVQLYPSPAATVRASWAALNISVASNEAAPRRLPWTLLQVQDPTNSQILATGMTDRRGEATLPVFVPKVAAGTTSVIATSKTVDLLATFDPGLFTTPPDFVPDPDALLQPANPASLKKSTTSISAVAGTSQAVPVQVAL